MCIACELALMIALDDLPAAPPPGFPGAPSMREAPLELNEAAFQFAERLFAGEFDMMILLTGVGTRLLHQALSTRYPPERFAEALRRITVVARGPKSSSDGH